MVSEAKCDAECSDSASATAGQEYLARVSHPIRGRRLHAKRKQPEKESGVPVFTAYVVVTLMAIAASTFVAIANFIRLEFVLSTAAKVGVSESWMTTLGTLNAAAALGLLLGLIGVPLIGTAAAVGLVLYFVGAIISPICAHAITRSALRPRSSCWPWPRWYWDWSRKPRVEASLYSPTFGEGEFSEVRMQAAAKSRSPDTLWSA
jgi:hypothetical protein